MPKYNVRRKAQLGLDIREGGIAIPIANNMFYIDGRKHSAGGVAIGPNNKNGVEVEGGEVVEMVDSNHPSVGRQFAAGGQQQTMRVFSSVPFLRGVSPAELVLGGANPDTVFKAQEEFKDKNRINDDGTTYEMGGEGKAKSKRSRPVTGVLPYGYTIRNLYAVENPYRKGIKGNVAKMYDSRTLGAGVDVVSGHPELYKKAKSGRITKKQADETAVIHLRKDDNAIRNNYADVYGKAAADTLSYGPRFLVAQARYQQGNIRKAWPAIHKAMAKGNAKALKKAVLQVTPKDHTYRRQWIEDFKVYKAGGIYIKPSKRGTFTSAATKHDMSVQGFANKVLANKEDYSTAMVKKANFARNASRWKKEYGGNMIYEINGNVKNGLMASRPKAQYGKIDRKNKDVKFGPDGLIYKRAADGQWYTDGTKHITSRPIVKNSREDLILANDEAGYVWPNSDGTFLLTETIVPEQAEVISRKFDKPKRTHVSGYAYEDEEKETKKIGSLTYEKNEDGQWVPASKQSITTTRDSGKPKNLGITRTGVNHPSDNYNYHPLTGEKVNNDGIVETPELSVKGTTKVSGQPTSTPRKRSTQAATTRATTKVESPKPATATNPMEARYASRVQKGQAQEVTTQPSVEYNETADKNPDKNRYTRATGFKAGEAPASPGNNQKAKDDEKNKDVRLIGQYKTFRPEDWFGLGTNLAGHIAGYFANNSLLKKYPMPVKPALFQAAKLKTTHNINSKLATNRETEQMNLAEVGRNTSSSSTSIARKQRIMNEARDARNKLYSEKENIETQLINLDRRNRQDVYNRNIAAFNDWLDKTYIAKTNKLLEKQKNMMSLINGIPGAVNHALGVIESRRNTNNTLRAIAAANPNVDARLIGGFDNYLGIGPDGKRKALYDKHQKFVRYI